MIVSVTEAVPQTIAALQAGQAVALPLPSPLPYAITATTAAAVNLAKGRPAPQPAGIVLRDFSAVTPFLAVDRGSAEMITWLCTEAQLNVFAPLASDAPPWLGRDRAGADGTVGLMGSWLPPLQDVLDTFGHLFISSANRTGQSAAVTAQECDSAFGGDLLVVDGDSHRAAGRPHGSATIVRVSPGGQLSVARHGINSEAFAGNDDAFLAELHRRYERHCQQVRHI